jgi:hypothetical protein
VLPVQTYRDRGVFLAGKGYPAVYWPDHPTSNAAGIVYVHRVAAFDLFGEEVIGTHVHHKNGNRWDWSRGNLELLSASAHASVHNASKRRESVLCVCGSCGKEFRTTDVKRLSRPVIYCSTTCVHKKLERVRWPDLETLINMLNESNYSAVARTLGVTDNAIRKRIRVRNSMGLKH